MEALTWRASNVVISYGAIRGGPASGTQERESCGTHQQGIGGRSGSSVEKATRFGDKNSKAAAPAGENRGRRFTLMPLPLPSAKDFVPAPLRFLWFPDEKRKSNSDESPTGNGAGIDDEEQERQADEVAGVKEQFGESSSKNGAIVLNVPQDSCSTVSIPLEVLVAGDSDSIIRDDSKIEGPSSETTDFQNEKNRTEAEFSAKPWFLQNIFNVNFLKKNSTADVKIPLSEVIENSRSLNSAVTESDIENANAEKAAERTLVDGGGLEDSRFGCECPDCGCAGSASESLESGSGTSSLSTKGAEAGPLTALEVPHVPVTHDVESFSKFLSEVPLTELKIISQASFLCNLAYVIPRIKMRAGDLARHHRMLFVTSSLDIKAEALAREKDDALLAEEKKVAAEAAAKLQAEQSEKDGKQDPYLSPAKAYALAAAAISFLRYRKDDPQAVDEGKRNDAEEEEQGKSPDSASASGPISSAEFSPSVLNDSDSVLPIAKDSKVEIDTERTGPADVQTFISPVTSVVSAEKETKQDVADNLRSFYTCPCEWFACDEKGGSTRMFSIQGSESFQSWQANLLFEPMPFETGDSGVMVHRGIYEAAKGLYEQILPQVLEHKEKHGDATKFQFTGHSLGGSLAVLLMCMLTTRGVLKPTAFRPVYTFGAPYVMCGGDYLLEKLGFPLSHVQYVVMNRDIVPRSFSCNYPDHVAEFLRRINGTFRDLPCLTHQKLLYAPMGQLVILQPDSQLASPHPLLPSGTGVYIIRHQNHSEPDVTIEANEKVYPSAVQVRAAQRAFLNIPHPLEIMSDPGAYGSEGSIAKNHDPRSYSKAINGVLRQEMKRLRKLHRERRRQLWWPLINAEIALTASKGAALFGVQKEQPLKGLDNRDVVGRWSGSSQFSNDVSAGRTSFPVSASGDKRGRNGRYKSLIASQHMQIGLLLLLTARMLIQEGFAAIVAWI